MQANAQDVQAILPEGYECSEHPTVLFEVMELRNLPWLAGRGYNTWGIYLNDVTCTRVSPPVTASYLAVLFESFTDPITTGREELGFPKVWAELPDGLLEDGGASVMHTASWFEYEFMRLKIQDLVEKPVAESTLSSDTPQRFTHPVRNGILHHRYVPAVGEPGKHDASYATFNSGAPSKPPVSRYFSALNATLEVFPGSFEQLPTLHSIVDAVAPLAKGKILEVAIHEIQGASDLSEFFVYEPTCPLMLAP